jgi:hypothetical protein
MPLGTVQVPEPDENVMMQSLPLATALAERPETKGAQLASVGFALAIGAVTTEMAERVETAKTRGRKAEVKRRARRIN